jgi:probable HAF family extracellular repeat protein
LFISICTTVVSAAPTITNLGYIPDGDQTFGFALSGNGTTVVGQAENSVTLVPRAFRWTAGTGAQDIGPSDATLSSVANGVNADGSVVVGSFGNLTSEASRWTAATGAVGIGFLPGGTVSFANKVSASGSVVVGLAYDDNGIHSIRWTAATGMQALPDPSGFGYSAGATDVSADGSVIVGFNANKDGVLSADRAYRYTDAGGYQDLGVQPGFLRSVASAVSGDGNTVVGFSQLDPAAFGTVTGVYRWTQSTGLVRCSSMMKPAPTRPR